MLNLLADETIGLRFWFVLRSAGFCSLEGILDRSMGFLEGGKGFVSTGEPSKFVFGIIGNGCVKGGVVRGVV